MASEILVAKDSFAFEHEGQTFSIPKGATVRAGHPILAGHEAMFKPLVVDFEHEVPTKPGRHVAKKPEGGDS